MELLEAALILADLKTQFEILDDLVNMDWMIFTYAKDPPWFYLDPDGLSEKGKVYSDGSSVSSLWAVRIDQHNVKAKELQGKLIDVLAALDLAVKKLGGGEAV